MMKIGKKQWLALGAAILLILIAINIREVKLIKREKKNAQSLFLQGKYDESIVKYNDLANKKKKEPLYYAKISRIYYIKGDEKKSKEYMDKVKAMKYTKNQEALSYVMSNYFIEGKYKEALKEGEEGVKLYPKNKIILNHMITLYHMEGQSNKARELLNNYPISKKYSEDLAEYGKLCIAIGDVDKGIDSLKEAYKKDKDNIVIYDTISQMATSNFTKTVNKINTLKKGTKEKEESIMYKLWLAKVYSLKPENCEEALKLLRDENIDKESLSCNMIKLSIYSNVGDFHNAKKVEEKLKEKYKDSYAANHSIAWYYLKKEQKDKAKEYCLKSIEENPLYTDNYGYLMPEILGENKNSNSVVAHYSEAFYREPFNHNIMMNAGNYFWSVQGDMDNSIKYYQIAEKLNKDNSEIKYNIATIYLDNNNSKGEEILKQCIKLNPTETKYYRTLSVFYSYKGKYKEAKEFLDKAYAEDKEDLLTLNNIAVYYIIGASDVENGFSTMNKAYEGAKKIKGYPSSSFDIIEKNFQKIKRLHEQYKSANSSTIEIPELTLFY
ncbi:hypothetical protein [Clostridium sp. KNHs214]|uniref:tetratricopeptide repeat protein n=1 Tax=Clostridium sp. KNHs214 TaxID=1540257 RepID=UPI000557C423|nr:hypothetical protein [Clostridium sp. KNHs214]